MMICEHCGNEFKGDYVAVGDFLFCPDCFENLTVDELIKDLGLQAINGNSDEDLRNDIADFKYWQEGGK